MKYRSEIDGLRAFAVVPVILFHAGFELFSGGFVGVDIFFVISGYLITTILIEDIENQRFSIASFYERRARRILPALFVVMLVSIPFAWMWMLPVQMEDFSQSLMAVSFSVSNILFWKESGYFDLASEEKPLLHTWSLGVEEQYYLLFPFLLILLWRFGRHRAMWGIIVIALFSLMLSEWGWRNKADANFYLVLTRAWELLFGSVAAFLVQRSGVQNNNFMATVGLVAVLVSIFFYDETIPFPSVYALMPVFGAVFIILFASAETYVAKILRKKLFVSVGLISYSAYLWHQPLFAFARILHTEYPQEILFSGLSVLTMLIAILSHKYIEQPFRNKQFLNRKQVLLFSLGPMLAFSIFGLIGAQTEGFKSYIITSYQKDFLDSAQESPKRSECHTGGAKFKTFNESCEYFGQDVRVAVLGDSHAVELTYALATLLEEKNIGVKHLSYSNCIPSYQIQLKDFVSCSDWTKQAVEGLIEDDHINTVVITYRIAAALYGKHEEYYPDFMDERGEEDRKMIWGALVSSTRDFKLAGKNVIYVLQAPELPRSIGYLVPEEMKTERPKGVSRDWWNQRMLYVYTHLSDLPDAVEVVDPADFFCDQDSCFVGNTTKAFYFDDDHMSIEGASIVAQKVIEKMD